MNSSNDIYDNPPSRRGTDCVKFDNLKEVYGNENLTAAWVADMDFPVPEAVSEALKKRMEHPVFGYSRVPDSYWLSVIRWISGNYGFTPRREELSYVPGIVRGIGFAINFLTNPGDKILIMPPVYHPFRILTEGNNRVCLTAPLISDPETGRFSIDFELLKRVCDFEKPKMMIFCNPHNPGGRQWTLEEIREVARIAAENNIIVISDEIHGDLMLNGKKHICYFNAGEDAEKTGIVFGAPSKTFNIPGLISSWMCIRNPELREGFYKWMEVNEFSSPTFFSTIATEAAYNHGKEWLSKTLDYISGNMELLKKRIDEIPGIKVTLPDASFLAWIDCRGLGLDQERLNRLFIEEVGLALNDGAMFGNEGTGFMRINLAMPRRELDRALERLKDACANLK